MSVDFKTLAPGRHPAPFMDKTGARLDSFDQDEGGGALDEYTIVPTALDVSGYHSERRTLCTLPGVCSEVTLEFYAVGPATITALNANGVGVGAPVMAGVTGAMESEKIVDPNTDPTIVAVSIEAGDNLDLLLLDWLIANKKGA